MSRSSSESWPVATSASGSDANTAEDSGYSEGALAVRPTLYFTKYIHTAVELSYQVRRPTTVD